MGGRRYRRWPKRRGKLRGAMLWPLILLALGCAIYAADRWNLALQTYYSAAHFGIATLRSSTDFNHNGVDDYTDILLGAREDAEKRPRYDGSYQPGGYPPDNIGVCTDVIWRAFKQAGYSLKDMVDQDMAAHPDLYPQEPVPDPNVNFRRVPNLKVFFERHALSLTTDTAQIAEWQPGDIVTFGTRHIGILSDRRNAQGIPFIIHNAGQPRREEDALTRFGTPISGHYRFDTSRLDAAVLITFAGP